MYQLSPPSFRFVVFLVEESRFKNSNGQQTQTQTTCYADTYEVNSDGSITFYQVGIDNGKRVKVPVLTYPHGKWTGIVLTDDHNQFPVFNGSSSFSSTTHNSNNSNYNNTNTRTNENRENSQEYKQTDRADRADRADRVDDMPHLSQEEEIDKRGDAQSISQTDKADDLDSVIDLFDEGTGGNTSSNNTNAPSQQPYSNSNSNNWNRNSQQHGNNPQMPNKGIPGISQNMNPNDFKKAKNELLEAQIKDYVKYNPSFNLEEIVAAANKESRAKKLGNISDTDVIWVASSLIREKTVQTRKFVEPVIQKNLSHMLPDIMRRQWSGKMGPILQVLEEREETKNVTAIDLAVWMVQNNFE